MSQRGHSELLLLLALFYQRTPSCLKDMGGWEWWVAHVILVSAQVLLVLTLGLGTWDLGLTMSALDSFVPNGQTDGHSDT